MVSQTSELVSHVTIGLKASEDKVTVKSLFQIDWCGYESKCARHHHSSEAHLLKIDQVFAIDFVGEVDNSFLS